MHLQSAQHRSSKCVPLDGDAVGMSVSVTKSKTLTGSFVDQGITVLTVTGEIFNRAADYPLDYRDHFDKLIAATAEIHSLDLVSEDAEIDRLGNRLEPDLVI